MSRPGEGGARAPVLLVEDNPDTVEFLRRRLQDAGYDVLIARNGKDAWKIVQDHELAAAILDINLPLLNGDEVCRMIRSDPRTRALPVVFVTADNEERVRDLLDDITLCLEKAIRTKTLLRVLQEVIPPAAAIG